MLNYPEDLFTVNKNSIEYMFKNIVDQRQGFKPTTKAVLKELVQLELKEIPFDGNIKDRNDLINETTDELIKKYIEAGKLTVLDNDEEEN